MGCSSVTHHEIKHTNDDRYIPSGIRPITQCDHRIHEGSDNIDINAETVDGKNTFHALARVVFQFKYVHELAVLNWWPYASLTDALTFIKPKSRVESTRRTNEFDKIKSCYYGKRTTVDDISIITRLLSRDVIVFPIHSQIMTQTIPFWTGFHCVLLEKRPDVTVVAYPPIIDAKSTDMSTVPTTMKECLDMPMDAGIWSTTLCDSPASKMFKAWHLWAPHPQTRLFS